MQTQTEKRQKNIMRFLAGIGVLALLVGAAWVGVRVIRLVPNAMSSLASTLVSVRGSVSNELTVTATPNAVSAGDTVLFSWEQKNNNDEEISGSYTFFYPCINDAHFETAGGDIVFCNAPFQFLNSGNSLELIATTTVDAVGQIEIPVTIDFTENGEKRVSRSGEVSITIGDDVSFIIGPREGDNTATSTATTTNDGSVAGTNITPGIPRTTIVPLGTTTVNTENPNGKPDLVVRTFSVGTLSGNDFTAGEPVNPNKRVAVRFVVENAGDKSSGKWKFEAILPLDNKNHRFESDEQESLFPGGNIEFTLGFDNIEDDKDSVAFTVEVDHNKKVNESNESNNIKSTAIDVK